MNVSTCDVLKSIGFKEDKSVYSNSPGGLSIDFGNFKMSASFLFNRFFEKGVLLGGVMSTSRSIGQIESEMPLEVESWEQGVAWVTWCLDQHSKDHIFKPTYPAAWLIEGRHNFHRLPWERKRVEEDAKRALYNARPQCNIQRDWARIALQKLAQQIADLDDWALIFFEFDGEILTIRCADSLIAVPGSGKIWTNRYSLRAGGLRQLPKRLMHEVVVFSVWNSALTIERNRYPDITAVNLMESTGPLTL